VDNPIPQKPRIKIPLGCLVALAIFVTICCLWFGILVVKEIINPSPTSTPASTLAFTPLPTTVNTSTITSTLTLTLVPAMTFTSTIAFTPTIALAPTITITPSATAVAAPPCSCSGDLYNCPDFSSHVSAQACYNYCVSLGRGDIHRLDGDGNGLACEN